MVEPTTVPISARRLILSTAAAAALALGVRLADAPSWTMKDVLAFAALTVGIAVAEQFSIPLRHRTETVNFSLTDALWAAALPLLAFPIVLSYLAYQQWVRTVRERNRMRDLYEAGRALAAPLSAADDFQPFLVVLEQMLEADAVELVVLEDDRITVHGSEGKRSFTSEAGGPGVRSRLEAFVRVHEDLGAVHRDPVILQHHEL